MLKNFISLYSASDGTPGHVLHVGAGLCDELTVFMQLGFEHLRLIEANPGLAEKLAEKTKSLANVEVQQILIAGDDGTQKYFRTSNPRFDSLKKPAGINEFYPNLEILSESTAETQSLNSLLQQYTLDASKNNLLVVEAQGAELDILEKTESQSLQQFAWIVIKTSSHALYEQAAQSRDLTNTLEKMAFELSATEELNFPFRVQIFKRNDAKIQLPILNSKIGELKRVLGKALTENEALKNRCIDDSKAALAERATLVGKLESSLAEEHAALSQLKIEQAQLKEQNDHLSSENTSLNRMISERDSRMAELDTRQRESEASLTELANEKSRLQADNESLASQNRDLIDLSNSQETEKPDLQATLAECKAQLTQLEASRLELENANEHLSSKQSRLQAENEALVAKNTELGNHLDTIENEKAQLQSSLAEHGTRLADLEANCSGLESEKSRLLATITEREAQIAELQSTQSELENTATQLTAREAEISGNEEALKVEVEQLKTSAAERTAEASSLIEQLQITNKSLNMNSKLLAKAEADNESLRKKYSEKVDSEQSLFELIKNLRDRLEAAANFYGRLEKDHPEIIHEQNRISSDSSYE